jgi:vitamin B12 transporter
MKGLLFAVALLISCATYDFAQSTTSTINGRVKDPNGSAVPNATVTLYAVELPSRITTTSDSMGSYRFERLSPGEYLIESEAPGFALASAKRITLGRAQSVNMDLSLEIAGVQTSVVVTASDTPQSVDEVSKAVSVVDHKEIDERDKSSLAEALRDVPGLRVQQLGGPGSFVSIKTRGLRDEDTAVLIDGVRFRDASAPQGDGSGLLEDLIATSESRIEVLRGSGSSLYGTNAVGGVINVVTDEGGGPFRGSLLLEGGSLGMFRGRARIAGGTSGDRIVFSAGLSHLNISNKLDGQDPTRNTSGQGRVLFRLAPSASLSVRVYAGSSYLMLNSEPQAIGNLPPNGIIDAVPLSLGEVHRYESGAPISQLNVGGATFIPAVIDPDSSRKANFFSGLVIFSQHPTQVFDYTISYQGLATNRKFPNGPAGVGFQPTAITESDFFARVHTLNARGALVAGRHNLVTGGYEFESESFRNPSIDTGNPANNSNVDVNERSHTLFVQDQLRFLDDRLQFSAGFRTQFFSLGTPQFTPTAAAPFSGIAFQSPPTAYTGDGSVAYLFRSTGTKFRAHAGNGYRAPSLFERFGTSFSSFGYTTFGDPRLRPERAISVDGGIDQTLFGNRLRASATYFYTRLQEVIAFDSSGVINSVTDPFGRFIGYINVPGGLSRGVELSASLAPSRTFNLTTSYTFTNSRQRTPEVDNVIRSLIIPDHQFSVVATKYFGRRLFVNFDFAASSSYIGPIFDTTTFVSRGYRFRGLANAAAGASYTLPLSEKRSVRFFGYVDNLFDREYFESGFRTAGRTARGGAAFTF